MKYISLNWTLALKFSIRKKKRMCDCRILMAHNCTYIYIQHARGAHTQCKRTHTSTHTHTHTIQIILYTQIHIYIIIKYTYTNMHIYIIVIVIHVHVNAHISILLYIIILLTKTTAAQNEVALGYHRLRGLYFPAVVSVTTICSKIENKFKTKKLIHNTLCTTLSINHSPTLHHSLYVITL